MALLESSFKQEEVSLRHKTCTRAEARKLAEDEIKSHVGSRIRQLRRRKGMTQEQLGSAVGVRFQQIQKYESGINNISAQRLWRLAEALDQNVSDFYFGLEKP
tara:strand:+ start:433218 stop:433526 length:309 start_codon:yes stop_codon:yes gene_type:complete